MKSGLPSDVSSSLMSTGKPASISVSESVAISSSFNPFPCWSRGLIVSHFWVNSFSSTHSISYDSTWICIASSELVISIHDSPLSMRSWLKVTMRLSFDVSLSVRNLPGWLIVRLNKYFFILLLLPFSYLLLLYFYNIPIYSINVNIKYGIKSWSF